MTYTSYSRCRFSIVCHFFKVGPIFRRNPSNKTENIRQIGRKHTHYISLLHQNNNWLSKIRITSIYKTAVCLRDLVELVCSDQ